MHVVDSLKRDMFLIRLVHQHFNAMTHHCDNLDVKCSPHSLPRKSEKMSS